MSRGGTLFGNFYYIQGEGRHNNSQFILGSHRESWLGSIRNFVVDAAATTFPNLKEDDYLVIKEPNGSVGAPLLMEALPESRMILLARDPRDVVASSLDAQGGRLELQRKQGSPPEEGAAATGKGSVIFAKDRAKEYLRGMGNAKMAYDAHDGPKALVRYEDLRGCAGTMRRMYSTLGGACERRGTREGGGEALLGEHPRGKKGEGKVLPQGFSRSLEGGPHTRTGRMVAKVTAPLLEELYPEKA